MPSSPSNPNVPLDVKIHNTNLNVAILLTKVHNLQADVHALTNEFKTLSEQLRRFLYDPRTVAEAEAARKDNAFNTPNSTKSKPKH